MNNGLLSLVMVEDSELDAELIRSYLGHSGLLFQVERVETEAELRDALRRKTPDVVLSDSSLPEFSGDVALRVVKEMCPDVPFIFVSGVLGEEVAIERLQQGATDYVLKQRLGRLVPAVQRALREAAYQREAKLAYQALRDSESRLRLALDTARLGDWELNLETDEISSSPQFRAHFGVGDGEPFSRERLLQLIVPEDRERIEARFTEAIRDRSVFEGEYRVRWADGSVHWLLTTARAVYNPAGRALRMSGVTMDVTKRVEAVEEQAQQARELAALNRDLEEFAYAASHDLQEPLRNVSSFSALLARRYQGQLDAEADEFLGYIVTSVRRMNDLLRDLLFYSRTSHDEREASMVDMNGVFAQAVDQLQSAIEETQAELTCEPLPTVPGAASQLCQVLLNLLSNALKYHGSVRPRIVVRATAEGDYWKFAVQDNGIGFEQQYADRIFGLFKRLHKNRYPGTGLGLAISKRIIERHHGKIWAESESGKGSKFYFTLPMSVERVAPTTTGR